VKTWRFGVWPTISYQGRTRQHCLRQFKLVAGMMRCVIEICGKVSHEESRKLKMKWESLLKIERKSFSAGNPTGSLLCCLQAKSVFLSQEAHSRRELVPVPA